MSEDRKMEYWDCGGASPEFERAIREFVDAEVKSALEEYISGDDDFSRLGMDCSENREGDVVLYFWADTEFHSKDYSLLHLIWQEIHVRAIDSAIPDIDIPSLKNLLETLDRASGMLREAIKAKTPVRCICPGCKSGNGEA